MLTRITAAVLDALPFIIVLSVWAAFFYRVTAVLLNW